MCTGNGRSPALTGASTQLLDARPGSRMRQTPARPADPRPVASFSTTVITFTGMDTGTIVRIPANG